MQKGKQEKKDICKDVLLFVCDGYTNLYLYNPISHMIRYIANKGSNNEDNQHNQFFLFFVFNN